MPVGERLVKVIRLLSTQADCVAALKSTEGSTTTVMKPACTAVSLSPAPSVATRETVYAPGVVYTFTGWVSVDVLPLPRSHA
jgi:hypothetical protein